MARRVLVGAVMLAVVVGVTVGLITSAGESGSKRLAPDFRLSSLGQKGSTVALSAFRGRPVVVNFFASWCGPCREELPLLARAEKAAKGKVAFVGVDVSDQDGAALELVHQSGAAYPVGVDSSYQVSADKYHLYGLPDTVFVDASGHETGMVTGPLTVSSLSNRLAQVGVRLPPGWASA